MKNQAHVDNFFCSSLFSFYCIWNPNGQCAGRPSSVAIKIPSRASVANEVEEYYRDEVAQVANGSIVTWTNMDTTIHTANAGNPVDGPSGGFDNGFSLPAALACEDKQ